MTSWVVDGIDHLYEQGFWIQHDFTTADLHQSALTLLTATEDEDTNTIFLVYADPFVEVRASYTLFGGPAGISDIFERYEITNISASTQNPVDLDLTFFVYTDADINDSSSDETAVFIGTVGDAIAGDMIVQTDEDGLSTLTVTAANLGVTHMEIAEYSDLLDGVDGLEDGAPTTLDDIGSPFGPGDATHAFQWDIFTLDIGTTTVIEVQKAVNSQLVALPEPGTLALLGIGLLAFGIGGRPRR